MLQAAKAIFKYKNNQKKHCIQIIETKNTRIITNDNFISESICIHIIEKHAMAKCSGQYFSSGNVLIFPHLLQFHPQLKIYKNFFKKRRIFIKNDEYINKKTQK